MTTRSRSKNRSRSFSLNRNHTLSRSRSKHEKNRNLNKDSDDEVVSATATILKQHYTMKTKYENRNKNVLKQYNDLVKQVTSKPKNGQTYKIVKCKDKEYIVIEKNVWVDWIKNVNKISGLSFNLPKN